MLIMIKPMLDNLKFVPSLNRYLFSLLEKKMQTATRTDKEITQQSYEATAAEFAHNVADLAPLASIEKFVKMLPPKAKILDIGCGSGRDAKIFSSQGAHVIGIDFCSNLLEIAKKHSPTTE